VYMGASVDLSFFFWFWLVNIFWIFLFLKYFFVLGIVAFPTFELENLRGKKRDQQLGDHLVISGLLERVLQRISLSVLRIEV